MLLQVQIHLLQQMQYYTSHSGQLVLTIPNHTFTTSDTVGIDTGGLVFKCSKDNFFSDHPYPRAVSKTSFPNSDPIAGIQTAIIGTTINTITTKCWSRWWRWNRCRM